MYPPFRCPLDPKQSKGRHKMRKIIRFAKNSTDVRELFVSGVAIASIVRLETGKYIVLAHYELTVWQCDRYTDARDYAFSLRFAQLTGEAQQKVSA